MADLSRFSRISRLDQKRDPVILILILIVFLGACQVDSRMVNPLPGDMELNIPDGMSVKEVKTLSSLDQIDDFPLYTMVYEGALAQEGESQALQRYMEEPAWACSLFAAYGDPDEILYGRNFDWDFSPALLLFMDPPGGYESVSMVDIHYLGFGEDQASGIKDLPLAERVGLLDAPFVR